MGPIPIVGSTLEVGSQKLEVGSCPGTGSRAAGEVGSWRLGVQPPNFAKEALENGKAAV